MELALPKEFVLWDLEYTAWKGSRERNWSGPNEYKEIIQVGAVRVQDFAETSVFFEYVKPVKNPLLSEFIVELTGVTQKNIDEEGVSFEAALDTFQQFLEKTLAYCWGIDTEILEGNSALLGGALQLSREQFHNIKPLVVPLLQKLEIDETKYSSGTLIQAFGNSKRRAHDAVNDMRNLLDAIVELRKI